MCWRWLAHSAVLALCIVGIFFAHEFSHAVTALAFGGRILSMNILGVQWIPSIQLATDFGFGGYTTWLIAFNSVTTRIIVVAGSTGTLLIAMLAALALNVFRVRGLMTTALAALSLYCTDSIVHIIPVLGRTSNSAPPWVRSFSEAYYALLDLGVPGIVYIGTVLVVTVAILALLARGVLRARGMP